ncbi:hypothetical protein GMMP15_660094 [Candidatus Magnetomoraceae bacterium gMMP-15]
MEKKGTDEDIKEPTAIQSGKLEIEKFNTASYLSKMVVIASIALIAVWMLSSFFLVYFGGKLDDALKILTAVIPFWSTITGTVLGYLFGKDK